ncbi:MAG: transposase [Firmicutes bacterium]|nr:transposase [Bacillota bacterium]
MARKPRVWYPGATYHVMCRGNRRQEIFRSDKDRRVYLRKLLWAMKSHRCKILSYCLMPNHVHLQVETTDVPLWKMMKQLNMTYAIYFNKKYDYVGYLFQDRYKAELLETDASILAVSRYIHLNPVAAKMVASPSDYSWSSYMVYLENKQDPLVSTERILACFFGDSRTQYKTYIERLLYKEENGGSDP